jgi:hypothetical protein
VFAVKVAALSDWQPEVLMYCTEQISPYGYCGSLQVGVWLFRPCVRLFILTATTELVFIDLIQIAECAVSPRGNHTSASSTIQS